MCNCLNIVFFYHFIRNLFHVSDVLKKYHLINIANVICITETLMKN